MYRYLEAQTIMVFATDTLLLNAEDALSERDLPYRIIPTPKEVHSACGLALAFEAERHNDYLAALRNAAIEPDAVYRRWEHEFTVL